MQPNCNGINVKNTVSLYSWRDFRYHHTRLIINVIRTDSLCNVHCPQSLKTVLWRHLFEVTVHAHARSISPFITQNKGRHFISTGWGSWVVPLCGNRLSLLELDLNHIPNCKKKKMGPMSFLIVIRSILQCLWNVTFESSLNLVEFPLNRVCVCEIISSPSCVPHSSPVQPTSPPWTGLVEKCSA